MLSTCKRNRNTRNILESDITHLKKTSYKVWILMSIIDISKNIQITGQGRNKMDQKPEKSRINLWVEATGKNN